MARARLPLLAAVAAALLLAGVGVGVGGAAAAGEAPAAKGDEKPKKAKKEEGGDGPPPEALEEMAREALATAADLKGKMGPPSAYVPVAVVLNRGDVAQSRVRMCRLDWAEYRANPTVYPFFEDLLPNSHCFGEKSRDRSYVTTLGALEDEYAAHGCVGKEGTPELPAGCAPSGIVYHISRTGSTLLANMMAVLPTTVMYSEPHPPQAIARAVWMGVDQRARWLRVVLAAMARPIFGYTNGLDAGGGPDWRPQYLYFKTQHTTSLYLDAYQAAFPRMPWAFMHRDPVEVMTSLLRNTQYAPPTDAPVTQHMGWNDLPGMNSTPCLRSHEVAPPFIVAVTGSTTKDEAKARVPLEDWCAADLAWVAGAALKSAVQARKEALRRALVENAAEPGTDIYERAAAVDVSDGAAFAAIMTELVPDRVTVRDGMVLDAETGTGIVMGVGMGTFMEYRDMPEVVPVVMDSHLRPWPRTPSAAQLRRSAQQNAALKAAQQGGAEDAPPAVPLETGDDDTEVLRPSDVDLMMFQSSFYSKSRATKEQLKAMALVPGGVRPFRRTGAGRLRPARSWSNMNVDGKFMADSEAKHRNAWPALRAGAAVYLMELRTAMLSFNPPLTDGEKQEMLAHAAAQPPPPAPDNKADTAVPVTVTPPGAVTPLANNQIIKIVKGLRDKRHHSPPTHRAALIPLGAGYPQVRTLRSCWQRLHCAQHAIASVVAHAQSANRAAHASIVFFFHASCYKSPLSTADVPAQGHPPGVEPRHHAHTGHVPQVHVAAALRL